VILGEFAQWSNVKPVYLDDQHDTAHRDHDGVPGVGRYINKTGRNDLETMHVGYDAAHLFFHVTTRESLTPSNDVDWMISLLDTDQDGKTEYLSYDYRLNQSHSASGNGSIEVKLYTVMIDCH
jgi:hypothetical protein